MENKGFIARFPGKFWSLAAIAVLSGLLAFGPDYFASDNKAPPTFPKSEIMIRHSDGRMAHFNVEVATTPEQQTYGLMFRRSLPRNSGMLFLYKPDQNVSMWMKNTYIPLDILFVRADGVIVKITTNARPLDLSPLTSDEPVRGVLELNAGQAKKESIKVGDRVLYSAFSGGS